MSTRPLQFWGLCAGFIVCCAAVSHAEFQVERVFGPEIPGGNYKHPATITELTNGDLYIAYYGGDGEYDGDTAVFGSRRSKGSTTWSTPQKIADTPDRGDGNGVVWQEPNGPVWLFYVVRYGATWSDSVVKYKYSKDGANTWTDSEMLTFEKGMMVRSQPIKLLNGNILLPIYHETGNDQEFLAADSGSLFAEYHKDTKKWTLTNKVYSRIGNIQPSVVQIDDKQLLAFCRRGGGYGPMPDGFIVKATSNDGGRLWSLGEDTEFPNPNAAVDLIKLKNGHLVMIYNDSNEGKRNPLVMRVSVDNGKTWPLSRKIVDDPKHEQGYPYIIQSADGSIHGVYTSHKRTVVNHFVINEGDIK